jgi:hypothetical protein
VTGELRLGQDRGQLEEGERVSPRLVDEALHDLLRRPSSVSDECAGRFDADAAEVQLWEAGTLEQPALLPRGEEEHDSFGFEPSGREDERLRRRFVDPVGIVDDGEERPIFRRRGEDAQGRGGDGEAARSRGWGQGQRTAQGARLHWRDAVEQLEHRSDELIDRRVGELGVRFAPSSLEDAQPFRGRDRVLQERALPDPWLAAHHKRRASPPQRVLEHAVDEGALGRTPEQSGCLFQHAPRADIVCPSLIDD